MAPVLHLVNRVAQGIEKEFPDKIIQTLAYRWSRTPPRHMRPRPNVVVMLCSIECCFSHPLQSCDFPWTKSFRADLESWSRITRRLWVWDYTTDFASYLLPFPNQRILGANIRYYVAHNVKGIFAQDTWDTPDSELATLGGYVMAKLLWDPTYNTDKAIDEFLEGCYGAAASPIRAYIDLVHDHVTRRNIHVGVYAEWTNPPHLTNELLIRANRLWQQAERRVAGRPDVLQRVSRSRLSVDFAIMEWARLQKRGKVPKNGPLLQLAASRFGPFSQALHRSALTRLREGGYLDKGAYCRDLAKELGVPVAN